MALNWHNGLDAGLKGFEGAVTLEWPPCQTHLRLAYTWEHTDTQSLALWPLRCEECPPPRRAFLSRLGRPCVSTPVGQKIVVSNPLSVQSPFCHFLLSLSVCICCRSCREVCWIERKWCWSGSNTDSVCLCVCVCAVHLTCLSVWYSTLGGNTFKKHDFLFAVCILNKATAEALLTIRRKYWLTQFHIRLLSQDWVQYYRPLACVKPDGV